MWKCISHGFESNKMSFETFVLRILFVFADICKTRQDKTFLVVTACHVGRWVGVSYQLSFETYQLVTMYNVQPTYEKQTHCVHRGAVAAGRISLASYQQPYQQFRLSTTRYQTLVMTEHFLCLGHTERDGRKNKVKRLLTSSSQSESNVCPEGPGPEAVRRC